MANTIPAVEKAVAILNLLGSSEDGVTQAELAAELDLSLSTCYRILQTLQAAGWIRKRSGKRYDLAGGILTAAMKLVDRAAQFKAAQPVLESLAAETGLCAKLSIREGMDQITISRAESPRGMAVSSRVGARFPVIEGSVGAALLCKTGETEIRRLAARCGDEVMEKGNPAEIFDRIAGIRSRGYCFNAGRNRWKVDAMSMPVLDGAGNVAAALTLLGYGDDFHDHEIVRFASALSRAVAECARLLD